MYDRDRLTSYSVHCDEQSNNPNHAKAILWAALADSVYRAYILIIVIVTETS